MGISVSTVENQLKWKIQVVCSLPLCTHCRFEASEHKRCSPHHHTFLFFSQLRSQYNRVVAPGMNFFLRVRYMKERRLYTLSYVLVFFGFNLFSLCHSLESKMGKIGPVSERAMNSKIFSVWNKTQVKCIHSCCLFYTYFSLMKQHR